MSDMAARACQRPQSALAAVVYPLHADPSLLKLRRELGGCFFFLNCLRGCPGCGRSGAPTCSGWCFVISVMFPCRLEPCAVSLPKASSRLLAAQQFRLGLFRDLSTGATLHNLFALISKKVCVFVCSLLHLTPRLYWMNVNKLLIAFLLSANVIIISVNPA